MADVNDAPAGDHDSGERPGFRERVESAADTQKQRAADSIGSAAAAAREAGNRMRGENDFVASWVSAAGEHLQLMADRLRDRRPGELVDELSRFARERPAMFLGGAFVLGLGVARLLKSSSQGGHGAAWPNGRAGAGPAGGASRLPHDGPTPRTGTSEWTPHAVS